MRIVSLVPSLTETLFELGVGASVVGVTHFCVHPPEARQKAARVGGTKTPDVARILELHPDLVCVNVEENRKEDVDALDRAGVRIHVTDVRTIDDVRRMIEELAAAVGADRRRAEALHIGLELALDAADAVSPEKPLPVFVPIWRSPWMTFNRDTYAHAVLSVCGADNRFAPFPDRYPTVDRRDVAESGARFALLPSEPYAFREKHRDEVAREFGIAKERVSLFDGEALTWWGARSAQGIREIAALVAALEGGL